MLSVVSFTLTTNDAPMRSIMIRRRGRMELLKRRHGAAVVCCSQLVECVFINVHGTCTRFAALLPLHSADELSVVRRGTLSGVCHQYHSEHMCG